MAITPFKNFGMAGVFLVLCLYGYIIVRFEQFNDPRSFWARLFYGSAITCSFLWFWLGDITMVRVLILAALSGFAYRAVCRRRGLALPARARAETVAPGSQLASV